MFEEVLFRRIKFLERVLNSPKLADVSLNSALYTQKAIHYWYKKSLND